MKHFLQRSFGKMMCEGCPATSLDTCIHLYKNTVCPKYVTLAQMDIQTI